MLSLIRPSSSPCLHQDTFVSSTANSSNQTSLDTISSSSTANALSRRNTLTSSSNNTSSPKPIKQRPPLNPSSSAPLKNASNYKELVAQFTSKAPQPYGVIPPRKKSNQNLTRSNSTSNVSSLKIRKPLSSSSSPISSSTPPSPTETSKDVVELLPTLHNRKSNIDLDGCDNCDNGNPIQSQIIQPLFYSLQSLLPESTSSSTRLGFWANLKAHYFAATTTTLSWSSSSDSNLRTSNGSTNKGSEGFLPPTALRVSNGAPVAVVDATASSASLTLTDALLSLPNLATPSSHSYHGSVNFPVSVAAMDKFKPIRSDTIPLKTFTYHETPVIERPQPLPLPHCPRSSTKKPNSTLSPPVPLTKNGSSSKDSELLPPLPRHLATRETRSNAAYLRMMAAELRMIRARKLVSPLKPRGFLPRRKDPFRRVKSPLSNQIEIPNEEDDHPLNDIMFGSWSSVSSTDSFLSTGSGYQTANEYF